MERQLPHLFFLVAVKLFMLANFTVAQSSYANRACQNSFDCGWPTSGFTCDHFGSERCVRDDLGSGTLDQDTISTIWNVSIGVFVVIVVAMIACPIAICACVFCFIRSRNRSRQQRGTVLSHGTQLTPVGTQYAQQPAPYAQNPSSYAPPYPQQQSGPLAPPYPQQPAPIMQPYAQPSHVR